MNNQVLVLGLSEGSQTGQAVARACAAVRTMPVYISDWRDWRVSIFAAERQLGLTSRSRATKASERSIGAVLLFDSPAMPPVSPEDEYYQAAEHDAMLFAVCLLAAPRLAGRWSYVVAGYSDTPMPADSRHVDAVVSPLLLRALRSEGAREAIVYENTVWFRRLEGPPLERRCTDPSPLPHLPILLELNVFADTVTPFVGLLPGWAAECDSLLSRILSDALLPEHKHFRPLNSVASDWPPREPGLLTVVAHANDTTARHLLHRARRAKLDAELFDLGYLYTPACSVSQFAKHVNAIAEAGAVFARPLMVYGVHDLDPSLAAQRHFALLRELQDRAKCTINRPAAGCENISKTAQLIVMGSSGLPVPPSLTTNDGDAVASYVREHRSLVFKSGSWMRTLATEFTPDCEQRLENLASCPTLFQKLIAGPSHRLHTLGDSGFGLQIQSTSTDYRFSLRSNRYLPGKLPSDCYDALLTFARRCGLVLSGCDLKQDAMSGGWYVLEVNRMPAFDVFDHISSSDVGDYMTKAVARASS